MILTPSPSPSPPHTLTFPPPSTHQPTEQLESRAVLSDILSVIAMAVDDKEGHCLNYRLTGSKEKISSFGHPYIR